MSGEKPPLGLMPRALWEEQRIRQIGAAIVCYANSGKTVPAEWIEELQEHVLRAQRRDKAERDLEQAERQAGLRK